MSAISAAAYPQLMSAVTDSEKIVYLCGAGHPCLWAHELSWTKWLLAGKEYLMAAEQSELEQRIGNWTTEELIDAATYLLAGLKETGKYQDFMDRTIASVHPVNKIFVEALQMIWRAGDLITTTNYDMVIEESVGNPGISYTTPADILSVIRGKSPNRVIHLHGRYDKENGWMTSSRTAPSTRAFWITAERSYPESSQHLSDHNRRLRWNCGRPESGGISVFCGRKIRNIRHPLFLT